MTQREQTLFDAPGDILTLAYQAFIVSRQAKGVTASTLRYYRAHLPRFVAYLREQSVSTPNQITSHHIRSFLVAQKERGLKPAAVHIYARQIKTFCIFCQREEFADSNPMARVDMPKVPQTILPAYTSTELRAILKACKQQRDRAIVLVLLDTGLRASEALGLTVGDIDLGTGNVMVHQGKGGKDRMVYLGPRTRRELIRYWRERDGLLDDAPAWMDQRGKALRYWGLRQMFERLSERSGVKITAHGFRRTFAIEMLRNGASIYHLQRLMGHSDLTVLRRYLDLAETDLSDAHRKASPVDHML